MPGVAVRPRWVPRAAACVDWAHPLAQGLLAFVTPWGVDVSGLHAVTGTGGPTLDVTDMGRALSGWSSSNYLQVGSTGTPILGGLAAWSASVVFATTNSTSASSRPLYGERGTSGNDILAIETGIGAANVAKMFMTYRDDGAHLMQQVGTAVVNDGRTHVVTVVRSGNGGSTTQFNMYVDGAPDAQFGPGGGAASMTTSFTNATLACNIGYNAGAVNPVIGAVSAVILHGRPLGVNEAASVARNPFAMLRRVG